MVKIDQKSLIPSPVNRLMETFSKDFRDGVDINLGVGYIDDITIAKESIKHAIEYIFRNPKQYKNVFNYGASIGSISLRDSVRKFLIDQKIGKLNDALLADK